MDNLPFPEIIDFHRAVTLKSHYQGEISPVFLNRLAESTAEICEAARADFEFFTDLQGLETIQGTVSCKVKLTCERCGEPFVYDLQASFLSSWDERKAKSLKLEDKIDLVELNGEGQFELLHYLEDCLLLEIPYAPRHLDGDSSCTRLGSSWTYGKIEEQAHPFGALKALKKQQ